MSSPAPDIEGLTRAQQALKEKYGKRAWFRGVGIAPSKSGLILRLNVDPTAGVSEGEIPKRFRGFDVDVVFIQRYERR